MDYDDLVLQNPSALTKDQVNAQIFKKIDELHAKINSPRTTAELKSSDPAIKANAQAAVDKYLSDAEILRSTLVI